MAKYNTPEEARAAQIAGMAKAREAKLAKLAAAKAEVARAAEVEAMRDEMPEPEAIEEVGADDLFTPEELAEIRRIARKQVTEELRKEKRALLLQLEVDRAREEKGLPRLQPSVDKERVRSLAEVTEHIIDLPEGGGNYIKIDQNRFYHGQKVTLTRAQFLTIREIEDRCWQHQALLDGKRTNYYSTMRLRDHGRGAEVAPRWRVSA
jgi:hypothetical protein